MLTDQHKKDMIADASCEKRRHDLHPRRSVRARHAFLLEDFCRFCDEMALLVPVRKPRVLPRAGTAYYL